MNVNCEDMMLEFQHLGIQCVRKKDIEESLKQRKEIRVDPFRQGFKHMENPQSIDLNAVKLCFQVRFGTKKQTISYIINFEGFPREPLNSRKIHCDITSSSLHKHI